MKEFIAAGVKWQDRTRYSRDDKTRTPTTYEARVGECRISITNGHIIYRPTFVFHCFELGFSTVPLAAKTHEEAAEEAVDRCFLKVSDFYEAFLKIKAENGKRLKNSKC